MASKGQAGKGRSTRQPAQRAGGAKKPRTTATAPQVTPLEIAAVARHLAEAFEQKPPTGIYVLQVLEDCAGQQQNEHLAQTLMGMRVGVRNGIPLWEAMAQYPDVFPDHFIRAVQKGETNGNLAEMLRRLTVEGEAQEVGIEELFAFTRDFSKMIDEDTSIVKALSTLAAQQANQNFQKALQQVQADVTGDGKTGLNLSEAMSKHPEIFPERYTEIIKEGELSKQLGESLQRLAVRDGKKSAAPSSSKKSKAVLEVLDTMDLLTFDQAVQLLGTSKPTLYRLLAQDTIKGLKVGRQWRFRKSDLVAYMERKPEVATLPEADAQRILDEMSQARQEPEGFDERISTDLGLIAESQQGDASPEADEAPVIRIINSVLMYAIRDGASDIHIEPNRKGVDFRYRIDGVLHEQMRVPQYVLKPLIQRFKVMADLDISERRVPQDGRIHIKMQDRDYDLRVSVIPSTYGESVVMRILDTSGYSAEFDLEKIGLSPEDAKTVQEWAHYPNGLLLINGPTGSGRTTTLYSCLHLSLTTASKTMTIEDPVEYSFPGATQVHVNSKTGLTFATALRAFLRHDPDIIGVGEIRDLETANLCCHTGLTGHLVWAVLHGNSAPQSIRRLLEMGIEPFILSAALKGALSQRLPRKICPECKEQYSPSPELVKRVRSLATVGGYNIPAKETFYHGRGCQKCRQTGYKGRTGIYEVLRLNSELSEAIMRGATIEELTQTAVKGGMKTLMADGARKAVDGVTTLEEVMRVVSTGW